jgi:hypothetical protein
MALLTVGQFVQKYNGKAVDIDKSYGPQCWDLAEAYCREVLGIKDKPFALATGNGTAYGTFNIFPNPNPKNFTKVIRSRVGGLIKATPRFGDLVVWTNKLPGSGGAGHVAICLANGSSRAFTSFDQNWIPKKSFRIAHNYDYVIGYLRPKKVVK